MNPADGARGPGFRHVPDGTDTAIDRVGKQPRGRREGTRGPHILTSGA